MELHGEVRSFATCLSRRTVLNGLLGADWAALSSSSKLEGWQGVPSGISALTSSTTFFRAVNTLVASENELSLNFDAERAFLNSRWSLLAFSSHCLSNSSESWWWSSSSAKASLSFSSCSTSDVARSKMWSNLAFRRASLGVRNLGFWDVLLPFNFGDFTLCCFKNFQFPLLNLSGPSSLRLLQGCLEHTQKISPHFRGETVSPKLVLSWVTQVGSLCRWTPGPVDLLPWASLLSLTWIPGSLYYHPSAYSSRAKLRWR